MKKKLKWIALAVVVLVLAGGLIAYLNLNSIVRSTIETQSASSLNLKTTLGGARLNLFGGSLALQSFNVGSPQGYTAPQMLSLDSAGVDVTYGQLRQDPVRVKNITLNSPRIVIEARGTKFNFQALMDSQSRTPPSGDPIKVIIDQLDVTNPQIALRPGLDIPGLQEEYTLTLPSLSLKNIGTADGNQNGVAIKEVVAQLLTTVAAKAAESDQLPKELRDILNLNVEAVAQKLGAEFNKQLGNAVNDLTKKLPGDVGKNIDKVLKDNDPGKAIEKGLGDLLGGKKKDPTSKPG